MSDKVDTTLSLTGVTLSTLFASMSITELLSIIALIISIITGVLTLSKMAIKLIRQLIDKINDAREDGVIDEQEKSDIKDTALNGIEDIIDTARDTFNSKENNKEE